MYHLCDLGSSGAIATRCAQSQKAKGLHAKVILHCQLNKLEHSPINLFPFDFCLLTFAFPEGAVIAPIKTDIDVPFFLKPDAMDDLTLDKWDALSPASCETYAKRLTRSLPTGFAFRRIRSCHLGTQKRLVAEFDFQQTSFVLIPGGAIRLGYDAKRWEPTTDERESWQETAEEYEIEDSIEDFISNVTLRPRLVNLNPFLMEVNARELGWQPISSSDPEVKEIIKHLQGNTRQATVCRADTETRVTRLDDGQIKAERAVAITHAVLSQRLDDEGFRFPTSDEWEYACSGGASTLFRWGDHVPCDRYPTDISPQEAAWRRDWVLSGGKLEYPPEGFSSDWDLHRRPNAFGIFIASDPYQYELTASPDITRGGDGGSMICGGAGFFVGWLTLSTAYFFDETCKRDPNSPISAGYTIGRRVLSLC
ncbi:MAG: hypothetical protein AB4426_15605 [Xenococcaceae cyanobacterium]